LGEAAFGLGFRVWVGGSFLWQTFLMSLYEPKE